MRMTNAEKQARYYAKHKQEKPCAQCGNMFMPSRYRRTLCSDDCLAKTKQERDVFKREHRENTPIAVCVCIVCGREYKAKVAQSSRNKYCSKACKDKANRQTAHVCERCGAEYMGTKASRYCGKECALAANREKASAATKAKHAESKAAKEKARAEFRKALCLGLRMWRAGKPGEDIAAATGYKSVSGFLRNSKPYRRISKRRRTESAWHKSEVESNAKSRTFKTETHFREHAAKELEKHFPCVMQEVRIPGSRRKIDLVVKDGLFRFGIELKNGNRTARMDQALGQAMIKCTFLGGFVPVVVVPDDVQIDALFLKASVRLGVIAGTLSQVIQQISLKCCGSATYDPRKGTVLDFCAVGTKKGDPPKKQHVTLRPC